MRGRAASCEPPTSFWHAAVRLRFIFLAGAVSVAEGTSLAEPMSSHISGSSRATSVISTHARTAVKSRNRRVDPVDTLSHRQRTPRVRRWSVERYAPSCRPNTEPAFSFGGPLCQKRSGASCLAHPPATSTPPRRRLALGSHRRCQCRCRGAYRHVASITIVPVIEGFERPSPSASLSHLDRSPNLTSPTPTGTMAIFTRGKSNTNLAARRITRRSRR